MTSPSAPRPAPASTAGGPGLVSIACTAALGFFLFGYDTAVINGSIDALSDHFGLSLDPPTRIRECGVRRFWIGVGVISGGGCGRAAGVPGVSTGGSSLWCP